MLYLVQRTDCERFRLAADIDPAYAVAYATARTAGVEVLCYGTKITPDGVWLTHALEVCDPLPYLDDNN
jgi:sugar fermentation stimulation protein A